VREVRRCERCGDPQVITENKEITTVETPADAGDGAPAAPEQTPEQGAPSSAADTTAGGTDDAMADTTGESTGSLSGVGDEWESAPSDPDASDHIEDAEEESDGTTDEIPQDDDAVIIADSGEESTPTGGTEDAGSAGQPQSSDGDGAEDLSEGPDESSPSAGAADPANAPNSSTDEGGSLSDDFGSLSGGDDSVQREGSSTDPDADSSTDGSSPAVAQGEEDEVEVFGDGVDTVETSEPEESEASSANGGDSDDGSDRSDGSEVVTGGASASPEDVEYYCPDCGHSEEAMDASLRAGDLCPECFGTYVEERPAQ
jgi:hypothetical protein